MKIYNETTKEEILNPDLKNGYLYDGTIVIGQELKVMDGTITPSNPKGLRRLIDIVENCKFYHGYSEEEKEKIYSDKIAQLSAICNNQINQGLTITLSDGQKKEFSYSIEDQSNISEMFNAILLGATAYPYHANNETCQMYSAQDIVIIYSSLAALKTSQITYFNQLKQYMKTLEYISDVQMIEYGQPLEGEFLENYNTLIQQAQEQMEIIISKVTLNGA